MIDKRQLQIELKMLCFHFYSVVFIKVLIHWRQIERSKQIFSLDAAQIQKRVVQQLRRIPDGQFHLWHPAMI